MFVAITFRSLLERKVLDNLSIRSLLVRALYELVDSIPHRDVLSVMVLVVSEDPVN